MATNWDMFDTYNVQEVKTEDGRNDKWFFLSQVHKNV